MCHLCRDTQVYVDYTTCTRTHTRAHGWARMHARTYRRMRVGTRSCLALQHTISSFQQAKKGLLTLTVRTRLTAPHSLSSHLSAPLSRSLSSSTCTTKDCSSFGLGSPAPPSSAAKPNYRVMVEVSLQKGRVAAPLLRRPLPGPPTPEGSPRLSSSGGSPRTGRGAVCEKLWPLLCLSAEAQDAPRTFSPGVVVQRVQ